MVDRKISDDMQATIAFIARHHDYPTAFGLESEFGQLISDWRPNL